MAPLRRRRVALLAAAALALVSVCGVVAYRVADGSETGPVPPAGTRYVGLGGVVIAVPASWTNVPETQCERPRLPYVIFSQGWSPFGCPYSPQGWAPPHVEIGRKPDNVVPPGTRFRAAGANSALGVGVSPVECYGNLCRALIRVHSPRVIFDLWLPPDDVEPVLASAVDSLRRLPESWTTVPPSRSAHGLEMGLADALPALQSAGLQVRIELGDYGYASDVVVASDPAFGAVIRDGGTVTLRVSTGEAPTAGASRSP